MNYGDSETQSYGSGTTASTFDAANRLLTVAPNGAAASAVTSDADGNTLTDTSGRTMTWDSQNRMASCTKGGVTSTYTYGADGLRRSSTVSGVTTYYAYDGQTMIREMKRNTQTGALFNTATYLQGPRGGEYRRDDTQVELDSQGRQVSVCRWYVYDGLGSVVGEVDPSGNLTSSPKYDVYGAVRGNPGTASTRQGFVGGLGHVSDSETGLVYMRARYYDPSNGRFVSEDLSYNGTNWFVYCNDNPTNELDKSGKAPYLGSADFYSDFGKTLVNAGIAAIGGGSLQMAKGALLIEGGAGVRALSVTAGPLAALDIEAAGVSIQLTGAKVGLAGAANFAAGLTLIQIGQFIIGDSDDIAENTPDWIKNL